MPGRNANPWGLSNANQAKRDRFDLHVSAQPGIDRKIARENAVMDAKTGGAKVTSPPVSSAKPKHFVLTFGVHEGRTLGQVCSVKGGWKYVVWLSQQNHGWPPADAARRLLTKPATEPSKKSKKRRRKGKRRRNEGLPSVLTSAQVIPGVSCPF